MSKVPLIKSPWANEPAPAQSGRTVVNDDVYNSERWRKVSKQRRSTPETMLCEVCKANGRDRFGDCVDHLIPIAQGGDVWDDCNHMTMCHGHHNRKSAKERHLKILIKTKQNSEGNLIPLNRSDIFNVLLAGGGGESQQI